MKHSKFCTLVFALVSCADANELPSDTTGADGADETTAAHSSSGASGDELGTSSSGADVMTNADESSAGSNDDESTGGAAAGCDGASLLVNPMDTSLPGPWPVGARTVAIDGLRVEVWYPAELGSQEGVDPIVYDIREQLPEAEQAKIADADNPWQSCDCWRDLPVDAAHGPYPAIVFVHGTASFRTQSLPQMVHWASRGFIVVAADHPGLALGDMLGSLCGAGMVAQDLAGDVTSLLSAIREGDSELDFLADRVDGTRIGMAGHSAGGNAIAAFSNEAQVLVPMAAGGTEPGTELRSTLVLGGTADSVVAYGQQQSGFAESPSPKRFVGISEAGHLSFSEICALRNRAGDDLLTIATDSGVCGAQFAGFLFQCDAELIADPDAWEIIDYATAAAFEETLQCSQVGSNFADLQQQYPQVADFEEE